MKNAKKNAGKILCAAAPVAMESLEQRRLLVATVDVISGVLTIVDDSASSAISVGYGNTNPDGSGDAPTRARSSSGSTPTRSRRSTPARSGG